MQLSIKEMTFSEFFTPFQKSTSIIKHLEKKIRLIAYIFSKLQSAKELVR